MPLTTAFWTTNGDPALWNQDFSGYRTYTWPDPNSKYISCQLGGAKFFQRPLCLGTDSKALSAQAGEGSDTGYFFFVANPAGTAPDLHGVQTALVGHAGKPGGTLDAAYPEPYGVFNGAKRYLLDQELEPSQLSYPYWAKFTTPWTPLNSIRPVGYDVHIYFPFKTGLYYLYHYQPWGWLGAPPEVVAAAVMKSGLSTDFINMDAFDDAYDQYRVIGGVTPWSTWNGYNATSSLEIRTFRKVGQRVVDFVYECARHARDFYFVDETGKLSVSLWDSATAPTHTQGLSPQEGVKKLSWEWSTKWLINSVFASWGWADKQWGNYSFWPLGVSEPTACGEEPLLNSYGGSLFTASASVAASITKYGEVFPPGVKFSVNRYGSPEDVNRSHYPLQYDMHSVAEPVPTATHWLNSDSKARRLIEVEQNMMGADYSLGDKLTGVELTEDGDTLDDVRCLEKEYDFDNLTVRSLLVEIPSNT